jgi:SAM-dependent methyltransferase
MTDATMIGRTPSATEADYDEGYFDRAPLRSSRALTTSTYRNLLFAWLGRRWPELLCGTGRSALEVGCGYGYVTELLARQGYAVTGVDLSAHAIARAQREVQVDGTRFEVWDAASPPPGTGPVDLLVALEVLEHLDDPDAALAAWARLLAPGGVLVCTTPNRHGPASRYWRDRTHVSVRSEGAWRRALRSSGDWDLVEVDAVQWVPGLWRLRHEIRFFPMPRVGAQLRLLARRAS